MELPYLSYIGSVGLGRVESGRVGSAPGGAVMHSKGCDGLKRIAELYHAGTCNPCYYHLNMKRGCKNGDRCYFCHYPHQCGKDRSRPGKAKRASCKKKANNVDFV